MPAHSGPNTRDSSINTHSSPYQVYSDSFSTRFRHVFLGQSSFSVFPTLQLPSGRPRRCYGPLTRFDVPQGCVSAAFLDPSRRKWTFCSACCFFLSFLSRPGFDRFSLPSSPSSPLEGICAFVSVYLAPLLALICLGSVFGWAF